MKQIFVEPKIFFSIFCAITRHVFIEGSFEREKPKSFVFFEVFKGEEIQKGFLSKNILKCFFEELFIGKKVLLDFLTVQGL